MNAETPVSRRLQNVRQIIIVLSGKGGVGKSSVTAQIALALYASSPAARIGVLDVDLTGPSIPRMLGLATNSSVHQSSDGWVPIYADGENARLACMSVGFLLRRPEDSVVWRGPKKNAMIRQFLADVRWGALDYLVVDTPPGTSDEHLSLLEHLSPLHPRLSSVIVTTPQAVALSDALRCLSFARTCALRVLGVVENMSGYACPCCGEVSGVFSRGGGREMARVENVPFLGAMPVDTKLVTLLDGATELEAEADMEQSMRVGEVIGREDDDVAVPSAITNAESDISYIDGEVSRSYSEGRMGNKTSFALLSRYTRTPSYPLFKNILVKMLTQLVNDEDAANLGLSQQ